jgi:hypothetical protein
MNKTANFGDAITDPEPMADGGDCLGTRNRRNPFAWLLIGCSNKNGLGEIV